MNYVVAWIQSRFGYSQVSWQVAEMRRRVAKVAAAKRKSDMDIDQHLMALERMRERFAKAVSNMAAELETSKIINKKLEAELATTLEALEAKEKIVIPGLVAACETLHSRWEADVAVSSMRKIAASVSPDRE